ncbi:MAG: glycosyltransferase family 4 protein [Clostridia bacterium]|nr:glycosyltransferase family 4 protein [Clostridia bacterium]
MNIDFYISSLSGGGAENVLTTLAKQLKNSGHRISITSLEKRPQFYNVDEGIELIKYDNKHKGKIKEIIADFKAIRTQLKKRGETDICVSFLSRCNIQVLLCSLFLKKKVVVCDRNNPLMEHSKLVFWLSNQIYRLASAVFVQTEQIKSFYPKYLQKKMYVIENTLDTEKLDGQCEGEIEQENTIISIGRLEPQKDFKTLISAFEKIAEKYPDWKVKIFGKGDMKDELQEFIDNKGLGERVLLCGRTETPFKELKKSKIFVLSSHYEGFPNVLCEGMYAGIGCISSDCVSGPSELINDGENGFLFPVGDEKALAGKLDLLLSSEEICSIIGERAKETVKRLELPVICEKWYNCLRGVTNET